LADLHGGSIHVESEVGRGSQFTVNLPWRGQIMGMQETIESNNTDLAEDHPGRDSVEPLIQGTVLLAEDNMPNILAIGEYLKDHGYEVTVAHDGLEAIQLAEETNPDVILMDIQMPAMDGLEATRRLRANPRFATVPIIALTALAMPGDRERCLEAGANEYVSKPVKLRELSQLIKRFLDHPASE
jgi:CheY-like chemotaxis protein